MKKITLFLCMLAIGFASAQTNNQDGNTDKLTFSKGTNLLITGFFLNTSKIETTTTLEQEDTRFGAGFNAAYAYAINDNLFLGLGLGYSYNKRESDVPGSPVIESTTDTFNVFPFIRYYKGVGKRFAFFVQGETRFSFSNTKSNGNDFLEGDTFFIGVRPGITYKVSDRIALETTIGALGYSGNNLENKESNVKSDSKSFDFNLNTSNVIFGLTYYF